MSRMLSDQSGRQSPDITSGTPTLRDEPVDLPLKEKSARDPNPEARPDEGGDEQYPEGETESRTPQTSSHEEGDKDVLIVDWDGPNDPENPRK